MFSVLTHNAILHTEAELKLEIRSFDEDCGDRGAAHNTQFYLHLIFQALDVVKTCVNITHIKVKAQRDQFNPTC